VLLEFVKFDHDFPLSLEIATRDITKTPLYVPVMHRLLMFLHIRFRFGAVATTNGITIVEIRIAAVLSFVVLFHGSLVDSSICATFNFAINVLVLQIFLVYHLVPRCFPSSSSFKRAAFTVARNPRYLSCALLYRNVMSVQFMGGDATFGFCLKPTLFKSTS
jgi:hypothetical protein